MKNVIPMMNILEEVFDEILHLVRNLKPQVKCKVFEDNRICIKVATAPSMTARTKHIGFKYRHFRSYVQSKVIEILLISATEQTADILTKPSNRELFIS